MELLGIVQLLTYSLGIYAFGALFLLGLRAGWAASPAERSEACTHESRYAHVAGMSMLVVCFVWFCVMLLHTLTGLRAVSEPLWIQLSRLVVMYQFPPLIALVNYADARLVPGAVTRPRWRIGLAAFWVVSESILVYSLLVVFHLAPVVRPFGAFIGLTISASFALTAVYSSLAVNASRSRTSSRRDRGQIWMLGLYAMMVALVALVVTAYWLDWPVAEFLSFVGTSLPLVFMFTATYHESRFQFFDIFVKRGLTVLGTIVLLTVFFATVLPRLERIDLGWARPWLYAIVLLPAVLSLPWLYRVMARWLDNVWLGRRLTTLQAIKRFVGDLGHSTDRADLIRRAEAGLREIFHAPVRIRLDLERAPEPGGAWVQDVPIRSREGVVGGIRLGPRENHLPWFSADLSLLDSLAEVFSYMLRAIDLHEKKREQEQLARELSLEASRSELKALRAQINPHFLFNALNAIAGLIHADPAKADETIEQLAEIFRYTLRGSESEWASLGEEMEFVRSYLEVERARFGDRLTIEVVAEPDAESHVVPTMMIQTLVENAVKHGVARVRGPARVAVHAAVRCDRLTIEVRDDGPGFDEDALRTPRSSGGDGGYGLHNIRERLRGHFADEAALEVGREEGRTVVRLVLPVERLREARGRKGALGSDNQGAA